MSTVQKAVAAALIQQAIVNLKAQWEHLSPAQIAQLKLIDVLGWDRLKPFALGLQRKQPAMGPSHGRYGDVVSPRLPLVAPGRPRRSGVLGDLAEGCDRPSILGEIVSTSLDW